MKLRMFRYQDIHISYQNIFMLMNDDRINRSFSPNKNTLVEVLNEYAANPLPHWVTPEKSSNFKRNFHIMERTGLFYATETV